MGRLLLAAGIFLLAVTFSPGRILDADVDARLQVTRAMWQQHSFGVDAPAPGLVAMPMGGQWTTYYGIGQSLAFIPFDWLGTKISDVKYLQQLPILFLYTPLLAVLWWLAVSSLVGSRALALVFFASTTSLYYLTRVQQEEALLAVLLAFALIAIRNGRLVAAGILAGAAVSVRLAAVLSLLPLLGAMRERRRWLVGFLPVMAAVLVVNRLRFGSFLSTGYDLLPVPQFQLPDTVVLWGIFLGLGKGLFVIAPPLLLAFLAPREWLRKNAGYTAGVVGTFIAIALLLSCRAMDFEGGQSWGVRYLVHASVFLLPLAAAGGKTSPRFAAGLVAVGAIFQLASVSGLEEIEYRQTEIEGKTRYHLLLSPTEGQLGRRLANLARWTSEGTLPIPETGPYRKELRHLLANYFPNVWGHSYGRRIPEIAGTTRTLWFATLALALLCLTLPMLRRSA